MNRTGVTGEQPAVLSDAEVVRRVLDGDVGSFEIIMRRYNQRLFRVARGIVHDDAEAEDVVQEAYLSAYRGLAQFNGLALFSTWLTKIAVNEALARVRRSKRLSLVAATFDSETAMLDGPANHHDAAEEASQQELGRVLAKAVDGLPPELRAVFVMRVVENLSTQETAECLNLSEANVKVRLHRARELLRTWIDDRIGVEARKLYQFDGRRCDRIVDRVIGRIRRGDGAGDAP
jgi:RNA polymerase sigma-70 factor (ECF subfamily)